MIQIQKDCGHYRKLEDYLFYEKYQDEYVVIIKSFNPDDTDDLIDMSDEFGFYFGPERTIKDADFNTETHLFFGEIEDAENFIDEMLYE